MSNKKRKVAEINDLILSEYEDNYADYQKYILHICQNKDIKLLETMINDLIENLCKIEHKEKEIKDVLRDITSLSRFKIDRINLNLKRQHILTCLEKYGIAVSNDLRVGSPCPYPMADITLYGVGYLFKRHHGDLSINDVHYIKYGWKKFHEKDIVQYISGIIDLNEDNMREYFNSQVEDIETDIYGEWYDGAQCKFHSTMTIALFPSKNQQLTQTSNCLVYLFHDKNVYHVNNGKYYTLIAKSQNWNNTYISDEDKKDYSWVIKSKKNKWVEVDPNEKEKYNGQIYLNHGKVVFCDYKGDIPFKDTYNYFNGSYNYIVFKDFNE